MKKLIEEGETATGRHGLFDRMTVSKRKAPKVGHVRNVTLTVGPVGSKLDFDEDTCYVTALALMKKNNVVQFVKRQTGLMCQMIDSIEP